jgi:hypothetical protein
MAAARTRATTAGHSTWISRGDCCVEGYRASSCASLSLRSATRCDAACCACASDRCARRGGVFLSVHHMPTGAGGDNGIAKLWNRREISVSSCCDRPHYLHPHPYICSASGIDPGRSKMLSTTTPHNTVVIPGLQSSAIEVALSNECFRCRCCSAQRCL